MCWFSDCMRMGGSQQNKNEQRWDAGTGKPEGSNMRGEHTNDFRLRITASVTMPRRITGSRLHLTLQTPAYQRHEQCEDSLIRERKLKHPSPPWLQYHTTQSHLRVGNYREGCPTAILRHLK